MEQHHAANATNGTLERSLGPWMVWGLGVGYVISGMYFGWNLGLPAGGTLGLAVATAVITVMYVTFTLSYAELSCAIPKAGGAFDYADRALGKNWGFIAGLAQLIEFVFAPPAIAAAIGAYFHIFFPAVSSLAIAIVAYLVFTALNIIGVKAAASFELLITILAVIELLIFAAVTLPHFRLDHFVADPLPNGPLGIFAAIPFAIWFYLAIEGVANLAEEAVNPTRTLVIGFGSAMATLVALCALTFFSSIGVAGWRAIVFASPGAEPSDSPLPLAMSHLVGTESLLYHILVTIGLFGLIASFHGIILAAGRANLEFGRIGYAPRFIGKIHPRFKTPANALIVNMLVGSVALMTGKTGQIITIACFGALLLYIVSMVALFALRHREPNLARPFRAPGYPVVPSIALLIAVVSLVAMTVYNLLLAAIFYGMIAAAIGWLQLSRKRGVGEYR